MTIKLSTPQRAWLDKIRGGLKTSPPIPSHVVRGLLAKKVIEEYVVKGAVYYRLSEEGWRFY